MIVIHFLCVRHVHVENQDAYRQAVPLTPPIALPIPMETWFQTLKPGAGAFTLRQRSMRLSSSAVQPMAEYQIVVKMSMETVNFG